MGFCQLKEEEEEERKVRKKRVKEDLRTRRFSSARVGVYVRAHTSNTVCEGWWII